MRASLQSSGITPIAWIFGMVYVIRVDIPHIVTLIDPWWPVVATAIERWLPLNTEYLCTAAVCDSPGRSLACIFCDLTLRHFELHDIFSEEMSYNSKLYFVFIKFNASSVSHARATAPICLRVVQARQLPLYSTHIADRAHHNIDVHVE